MKFLKIKNTEDGELLKTPKILEMGVDFDMIFKQGGKAVLVKSDSLIISPDLIEIYSSSEFTHTGIVICNLSDCYQSRSLIEIDGFCEFDVITRQFETKKESWLLLFTNGKLIINDTDYYQNSTVKWLQEEYIYCDKANNFVEAYVNKKTIFTQDNQVKYPELYQEALEIINKVHGSK